MLQKLALACASVLFALLMLEGVVRVGHFEVHDFVHEKQKYGSLLYQDEVGGYYRHPGKMSVVLQGVTVDFNSLGMRDDEPRPKRPGAFRILCLGDSMVFGPAVPQDRIFPARLRAMLAPEGIEVVAAGVQGWNTVEEDRFLSHHIDELAPDLVVLLYVTNDNEPIEPWRRVKQPAATLAEQLYRTLVLRSRLFEWGAFVYKTRVIGIDWPGLRQVRQWKEERAKQGVPFSPDEPGWLESRAALGRLLALTRAHDAGFVVFLYDMDGAPPAATALERLREFGAETGVPIFTTRPFFADRRPVDLINMAFVDPHPNAAGHDVLARGIADTLRSADLLAR
jgi:lysophospholipase L1-like esterase